MSYFPQDVDIHMRRSFITCPMESKLSYVNNFTTKDDDRVAASMLHIEQARGHVREGREAKGWSIMDGYHPFLFHGRPVINRTVSFKLKAHHPTTTLPLQLCVHIPALLVSDEDGTVTAVCDDPFDDKKDTDDEVTAILWAANQVYMAEATACLLFREPDGSDSVLEFRPDWMQKLWFDSVEQDFIRMVSQYKSDSWGMRLDAVCTACQFKPLCLDRRPSESIAASMGYKRVKWNPKTRERKEI